MDIFAFVLMSYCSLVFFSGFLDAVDSITQSQSLIEGMTLVSKDESFVLGFFSPGNSINRYLGIWYNQNPVTKVVWVANRSNPIKDMSGVLMVNSSGSLVLLSQNNTVGWSTNSTKHVSNPILQLLDSGNLVVREEKEENPENYLWQSFDYPCDTLLLGMKLGWDSSIGLEWHLSAWKSPDDPSPGDLTYGIEHHKYNELVLKNGSEIYFRTSPWNGYGHNGVPDIRYNFFSNKDKVYYIFQMTENFQTSILILNETNLLERYIWDELEKKWILFTHYPKDQCNSYGICGAYGNCTMDESPFYKCLEGFKPKSPDTWNQLDFSMGCVRTKQLSCQDKIEFAKFVGLKLPNTTNSWVNGSMNLEECRVKCLNNCSCTAYSNSDIRDEGSGCVIWYGDLIDIRQNNANGQELYIRMSASEIGVFPLYSAF